MNLVNPYRLAAVGGGGGMTCSYVGQVSSTSGLTTYTFTGVTLGVGKIYLIVATRRATATYTVNSVTIDGASAANHATNITGPDGSTLYMRTGIWSADCTSATGTVVVTASDGLNGCGIGVFLVTGAHTVLDADSTGDTANVPLTVTLDTDAAGFVIAGANVGQATTTQLWSGVTEDFDVSIGTNHSYGGAHGAGTGSPLAVTTTINSSRSKSMSAVSLAPV